MPVGFSDGLAVCFVPRLVGFLFLSRPIADAGGEECRGHPPDRWLASDCGVDVDNHNRHSRCGCAGTYFHLP
jgi:hypothetical protein